MVELEATYKLTDFKNQFENVVNHLVDRNIQTKERPQITLQILEPQETNTKLEIVIKNSGYEQSKRKFGDGLTVFGT